MDDIIDYIVYVLQNYGVVMLVMISLVEAILFGIKIPIKMLTSKIKNEKLTKLANKIFILLSFVIALGLYALGHYILPQYVSFKGSEVIATGAFSVVAYACGEGLIKIDLPTLKKTSKAADKITNVVEEANEGKVKEESVKEVKDAVNDFASLCKDVKKEVKKSNKKN